MAEDNEVDRLLGQSDSGPPSSGESGPGPHPSTLAPSPKGRRRRGRWTTLAVVLVSIAALASLFGFGLTRDPTVVNSPLIGRRAPNFALRTLDGSRTVQLSDFRGQVVVVNFWASWCGPCRREHPELLAAWGRYREHGMVLIGVDYQDSKKAALAFIAELGGDWPVVEDPGSRTALAYGVLGVPETYFIDTAGVVRYKQVGPVSYELLTDQIHRLLPSGSR